MKMRIEERRLELGLTQVQLCKAVGICRKSYNLYVKAQKPIPSDKLLKFSEALNCSVDYLLGKTKYTQITVTNKEGVPIAVISNDKIVEHEGYKVILS